LVLEKTREQLQASFKLCNIHLQMSNEMISERSVTEKTIETLSGQLSTANDKIANLTNKVSLAVKESLVGYAGAAALVLLGAALGTFSLYSARAQQKTDSNTVDQKSTRFKQIRPYLFMLPTVAGLALGAFSSHCLYNAVQQL
jgi:hypothetical protein